MLLEANYASILQFKRQLILIQIDLDGPLLNKVNPVGAVERLLIFSVVPSKILQLSQHLLSVFRQGSKVLLEEHLHPVIFAALYSFLALFIQFYYQYPTLTFSYIGHIRILKAVEGLRY